jgi:hypothetical protein
VFSNKLGDRRVWALPGTERPTISIKKVNFKAVAAVGAMDI